MQKGTNSPIKYYAFSVSLILISLRNRTSEIDSRSKSPEPLDIFTSVHGTNLGFAFKKRILQLPSTITPSRLTATSPILMVSSLASLLRNLDISPGPTTDHIGLNMPFAALALSRKCSIGRERRPQCILKFVLSLIDGPRFAQDNSPGRSQT
jgi:hypothetical protein